MRSECIYACIARHRAGLAPAAGLKPELAITDELYDEILSNIRHMGATFEGTPQTYKPMGEEGLRDILLASLNGVYQGAATGEALPESTRWGVFVAAGDG